MLWKRQNKGLLRQWYRGKGLSRELERKSLDRSKCRNIRIASKDKIDSRSLRWKTGPRRKERR